MKAPRLLIVFVCLALAATAFKGTILARDDRGSLGTFEKLVIDLHKRGDTNTAQQVSELVSEVIAEQKAADAMMQITILERLRSGRTNEALKLLEVLLDGSLASFGVTNDAQQNAKFENVLKRAREYRAKHPHDSGSSDVNKAVGRALGPAPN